MAALRKASVYKKIERSYTRKSKVRSKSYIKTVPSKRVVKYVMGDASKHTAKGFPYEVTMIAKEGFQIRDNAIEAARQLINRHLTNKIGKDYYFSIVIYPHHILREHKIAAVAQSDRFFSGMSHAFGKVISNAAQIKKGKKIFIIEVNTEAQVALIRHIYKMASSKFGAQIMTVVKKLK